MKILSVVITLALLLLAASPATAFLGALGDWFSNLLPSSGSSAPREPTARDLQAEISGRISHSTRLLLDHDPVFGLDHHDVTGGHTVIFPIVAKDVSLALRLARKTNHKVLVRSGSHSTGNERTDGTDSILLNLRYLDDITVSEPCTVRVEAGVTVGALAASLADHNLFLPLPHNPTRSIVSEVLGHPHGPLARSTPSLRSHVTAITIATPDGSKGTLKRLREGSSASFDGVIHGYLPPNTIITSIEFAAQKESNPMLWFTQLCLPYSASVYKETLASFLSYSTQHLHPTIDLELRVFEDRFDLPEICVVVTGKDADGSHDAFLHSPTGDGDDHTDAGDDGVVHVDTESLSSTAKHEVEALHLIRTVIPALKDISNADILSSPLLRVVHRHSSNILDGISHEDEPGTYGCGEYINAHECTEYETVLTMNSPTSTTTSSGADFVETYAAAVDLGVGGDDDHGLHLPGSYLVSSLHTRVESNKFLFSAFSFESAAPSEEEANVFGEMKTLLEDIAPRRKSRSRLVGNVIATEALTTATTAARRTVLPLMRSATTTVQHDVLKKKYGFKGLIVGPSDPEYPEATKTYSRSSYVEEYPLRFQPFLVVFPEDVADVEAAVKYATKEVGKKVIPRSGGHQYSGRSSGGPDSIVVALDKLNNFWYSPDGKTARLGPGCRLENIASQNKQNGVTIPHGECPLVAIGGHVQSGGFGHLLGSFGVALDYCRAFSIVLHDGITRRVCRDSADCQLGSPPLLSKKKNEEIFSAVLGGGPGSWGVLVDIEFDMIRDIDHKNSYIDSKTMFYSPGVFKEAMKHSQAWSNAAFGGEDPTGEFGPSQDLMFTAINPTKLGVEVDMFLLELVYADNSTERAPDFDAAAHFKPFLDRVEVERKKQPWFNKLGDWALKLFTSNKGPMPLSSISHSFVRTRGSATTKDGREFKWPYIKRFNCLYTPLTDDFVEGLTDLVTAALKKKGVYLVFQLLIGGHMLRDQPRRNQTSLPRRDVTFGFVYDTFYDPKYKANARELQDEMTAMLERTMPQDKDNGRMTWGSYSDTDLNHVWAKYYDSKATYERLQSIKQDTDPTDVFHTPFTVQLPFSSEHSPHEEF